MKRPMAAAGITCLAVQMLAISAGPVVTAVLLCASVLGIASSFILLTREHRRMILPVLISCVLAAGAYTVYELSIVKPAHMLEGRNVFIRGTIAVQPYDEYDRCYYIIDTDFVGVHSAPQKIRVRVSDDSYAGADVTDLFAGVVRINESDDSERFFSKTGRISRGIVLTGFVPYQSEPQITTGSHGLKYRLEYMRAAIREHIDGLLSDDLAALLEGVLLGDKSGISEDTVADFRTCGLSHLLAVSGLHMSVIVFALTALLRSLGVRYRPLSAVVLVFLAAYMAMTGFSYSVMRAGIMTGMMLVGRLVNRQADSLNSLGFALLVICTWRPYAAADLGLLLSASATLGLILLHRSISGRLMRLAERADGIKGDIVRNLLHTMTTNIVAAVSTLPVIMLCFGECSLVAPLANLLCVGLSTVFLISGGAAVVLSFIPLIGGGLSHFIIALTWFCGRMVQIISHLLASLPNASVNISFGFSRVFMLGSALLLLLWFVLFGREKGRLRSFALTLAVIMQVFMICTATEKLIRRYDNSVTICSVGDGLAAAVTGDGRAVVIGSGGDRYDLVEAAYDLNDNGRSCADAVILTDDTEYMSANIDDMIKINRPKRIFMLPESDVSDETAYAVSKCECDIYDVRNASFESETGSLSVHTYTDSSGDNWIFSKTGEITVLVCPDGGDCALLPDNMTFPDCAVVRSADIANMQQLRTAAFVVSADEDSCAQAAALLRYRGAQNVYCTDKRSVVISEYGTGVRIGER